MRGSLGSHREEMGWHQVLAGSTAWTCTSNQTIQNAWILLIMLPIANCSYNLLCISVATRVTRMGAHYDRTLRLMFSKQMAKLGE